MNAQSVYKLVFFTNRFTPTGKLIVNFKILLCLCVIMTGLSLIKLTQSIQNQLVNHYPNSCAKNTIFLLTVNPGHGRLGNKMFKYASLLGIAKREGRKPTVLLDGRYDDVRSLFNLSFVEHIDASRVSSWEIFKETAYAYYDPTFENLPQQDLKLNGFLQSWKYFYNVQDVIRKEFTPTKIYKDKAEQVLNEIIRNHSHGEHVVLVGVHVRRPDELSRTVTCVSPRSYFMNAFQKMKTLLPGEIPLFIVAGNDLAWCRENLASNDTFVLPSYSTQLHFAILASCRHFIVSVGSYGWWAGWLTGGRVIYYKKFPLPRSPEAIGFHFEDYYPPEWIGVDD